MAHKVNHSSGVFRILRKLKEQYEHIPVHQHIFNATSEHGNKVWLDDKELFKALQKYEVELQFHEPSEDTTALEEEAMLGYDFEEEDDDF